MIDPSVIRNVQLPTFDPLEGYAKALSIKGAIDESKVRGMQMQQMQQSMSDDQAARQLFAANPNATASEILSKLGPNRGMAVLKAQHEAQKAEFEKQEQGLKVASAKTARMAQLAGAMTDQATYEAGLRQALSEGLIPPEQAKVIPAQFNPEAVKYFQQQALTANEQINQKRADLEMQFKKAAEDRAAALFPTMRAKAEAEALSAQQRATGQEPIQPKDKAMIDATRSAHEDTVRHQRVMEQQGAARLGMEQRKFQMDQGALQRTAQALANGDMTKLSDVASMRGDQRLILFDMAKQINPNFNTAEVNRKIKNEEYYTVGKGADNLRSFGTFLEHAGDAMDAVGNIRLSKSPLINKPLNWWRQNVSGSPELTRLQAAIEPAKKEYESFLLGGHALQQDDRRVADRILNPDKYSPAQLEEALKTIAHVAKARFTEENYKYKRVSGRDLQDPFSPEAVRGAAKVGINFGGSGGPQVGDVKSYNGANYRFDGTQWVKQ